MMVAAVAFLHGGVVGDPAPIASATVYSTPQWELDREALAQYCDGIRSLYRESATAGRPRTIAALALTSTLWDYLSHIAPAASADFSGLAVALGDAERGIKHSIIAVKPNRGRPLDLTERWELRARVLLAIKFLVAGGMSEDGATRKAARLRGVSLLAGRYEKAGGSREKHLIGAIESWRATLEDPTRPRNEAALRILSESNYFFETCSGLVDLSAIGRDMLRNAGAAAITLDKTEQAG